MRLEEQGVQRLEAGRLAEFVGGRQHVDAVADALDGDSILPINDEIATHCAHLHIPDRRNEVDALIAATALVHGLTVVTRNVRDFEGIGVVIVNPWQN